MVAATIEPTLDDEAIGALLDFGKRTAPDGTETYDLNAAAAEGWRWKAGMVSNLTQSTADGSSYHDEQLIAHCERMIAQYAAGVLISMEVRGA
jgi:hypothetical protein